MPIDRNTLKKYLNPVFLETGTEKGNTTDLAVQLGFSKVISIEADLETYEAARRRFSSVPQVFLVYGDSGDVIWDIIKEISSSITFWLDGHGHCFKGFQTPLVREISEIGRHHIKSHTILVDDMRILRSGIEWAAASKVGEEDVIKAVREAIPNCEICYEGDPWDPKDILVARVGRKE